MMSKGLDFTLEKGLFLGTVQNHWGAGHLPLKRFLCIAQSKQHHVQFVEAVGGAESCLRLIVLILNPPVQTQKRKHAKPQSI